jgi:hypothetical protein
MDRPPSLALPVIFNHVHHRHQIVTLPKCGRGLSMKSAPALKISTTRSTRVSQK